MSFLVFSFAKLSHKSKSAKVFHPGDVGMWYYATNTGLPGAFIRSNDRRCYVEMYEQNEGENTYDTVRRYTGYFVVPAISTDPYRTNSWSCTFTQPNIIETDGTVELGMYYYVTKITGDTGVFVLLS